jgi:hypothetical protein
MTYILFTVYLASNTELLLNNIARQQLAKHVPKRYALNKNRCPLLGNGFDYHGSRHVPVTTPTWTTMLEPFKTVIFLHGSQKFIKGGQTIPREIKSKFVSE